MHFSLVINHRINRGISRFKRVVTWREWIANVVVEAVVRAQYDVVAAVNKRVAHFAPISTLLMAAAGASNTGRREVTNAVAMKITMSASAAYPSATFICCPFPPFVSG